MRLIRGAAVLLLAAVAGLDAAGTTVRLVEAVKQGNVTAVKALIAQRSDVNAAEQWQGQTPLMFAASQNNAAAVKALIDAGANKDEKSKLLSFPEFKFETSGMVVTVLPRGGWTALMYAARDGAIDAVGTLAAE